MKRGMNLTHNQARELLQKSLQARLDAFENAAVAAHLADCTECAAYAAETRSLDHRLAASLSERWPEPRYTAEELDRRMTSMQSCIRREAMFRTASSFARLAGAAVALLLLIAGLVWLVNSTMHRPSIGASSGETPTFTSVPTLNATQTATVQAVAGPTPDVFTYTVRAGDTCSAIAGSFKISIRDLVEANPLLSPDCSTLVVGQNLRIVKTTSAAPAQLSPAQAEALVRAWYVANNPGLDSEAKFPLQDITTTDILMRLRAQVFKVTDGVAIYESFLIRDGQVWKLGNAFGGMGINNLQVTDLDQDGSPELVYTYSFGSGIHQASLGMAREQNGQIVVKEAVDIRYLFDLGLEKRDDQTLVLKQLGRTEPPMSSTLGMLRLVGGALAVAPDLMALTTYTSPRFGISFQVPADWQRDGTQANLERYASKTGFFELSLLKSGANMQDFERACEWEANGSPARYGAQPQITMITFDQTREACLIQGPSDDPNAHSAAVFASDDGQVLLLAMDTDHTQVITQSLRFTRSSPTPAAVPIDMTPRAPTGSGKMETRAVGSLALNEYAVVSASVDTPGHMEFDSRIPKNLWQKRIDWLDTGYKQRLVEANRRLAPFGYRLVEKQVGQGVDRYDLFHNSELVKSDLSTFWPVSVYQDDRGSGDFAMIINGDQGAWLVRKDTLEQWDEMLHHFTPPVFAGQRLITVERDAADASSATDRAIVKQDGQPIFTYVLAPLTIEEPVKKLDQWNGGWVLEVDGTLIVNGAIYNQKDFPADEIFNWTMLNGKPFFFFRRDGKTGAWYDGKELPLQYDEIMHGGCCESAAFNVATGADTLWFYARRDGMWYIAELGLHPAP